MNRFRLCTRERTFRRPREYSKEILELMREAGRARSLNWNVHFPLARNWLSPSRITTVGHLKRDLLMESSQRALRLSCTVVPVAAFQFREEACFTVRWVATLVHKISSCLGWFHLGSSIMRLTSSRYTKGTMHDWCREYYLIGTGGQNRLLLLRLLSSSGLLVQLKLIFPS